MRNTEGKEPDFGVKGLIQLFLDTLMEGSLLDSKVEVVASRFLDIRPINSEDDWI